MLNVREMIDGNPARMRYVYRYSTSRTQHRESVAEHSWFVAFFALQIGAHLQDHGGSDAVDMGLLLTKSILHDIEEARSGDFPRPFKYSDPDLKRMLDRASVMAARQVMEPLWLVPGEDDESSLQIMIESWRDAKDESNEGRIVEFCDFLSVLGFLMHEFAGGNRTVERHVADMREYFNKFLGTRYNFLRDLIQQAGVMMREVFSVV